MQRDGYQSDGLVFLHGFNSTFDNAAIYAGQLAFDLKIPNTAFFSWPSQGRGTLFAYSQDEETIRLSEDAIFDFLVRFSAACPNGKMHIIAHSMGNRGLLSAFYLKIVHRAEKFFPPKKIGQIFLAAPDVNSVEFEKQVAGIIEVADRVTLYTSNLDLALWASSVKHHYMRAGTAPPFTIVDGVDTVHVPLVDLSGDFFGHSYFARMATLLYDMHLLIQTNLSPDNRPRLCQKNDLNRIYWEFTQ
jgi:esterase/lipase superfamily enzyme